MLITVAPAVVSAWLSQHRRKAAGSVGTKGLCSDLLDIVIGAQYLSKRASCRLHTHAVEFSQLLPVQRAQGEAEPIDTHQGSLSDVPGQRNDSGKQRQRRGMA